MITRTTSVGSWIEAGVGAAEELVEEGDGIEALLLLGVMWATTWWQYCRLWPSTYTRMWGRRGSVWGHGRESRH